MTNTDSMWLFGYGSLLWNPDFEYDEQIVGFVQGYKRRFWLFNETHRGIPGKPGRVATLVKDLEKRVWGIAYKISKHCIDDVRRKLSKRERDYMATTLSFHPKESGQPVFDITLYIASPEHPNFGPASDVEIAKNIYGAVGPSGTNIEYLLKLAHYVRENIPEDQDTHLFTLEHLVTHACGDHLCPSAPSTNHPPTAA